MHFATEWNEFAGEFRSVSSLPGCFVVLFKYSRDIVECTPALHGLTPKLVLQSAFAESGPGAFQSVAILSLDDTVGLWSVVRSGVVPPFEGFGCHHQLSSVVGVEELRVRRAREIS